MDNTLNAVQKLWSTPLVKKKFENHTAVNKVLTEQFYEFKSAQGKADSTLFSSPDDLLERFNSPAISELFQFISNGVFEIASSSNQHIWQQMNAQKLSMHVVGAWFQIQNNYGFHDIHSHGNCSWSGVYYVQIDEASKRHEHPNLGALNGITRFYSPRFDLLGGAYADMGNAYLQDSHFDIQAEEGTLVIFPSWLNHKAMPYDGDKDRIIISFNAQVHGEQGDKAFEYSFH